MKTRFHPLTLALAAVAASLTISQGALTFNTVGVYDSSDNSNVVDRTASGNFSGFTSAVSTAFNNNSGGVVNFDGSGTSSSQSGINAKYGTGLGKTLAISTSTNYNVQFSSNIRAISGTENGGTGLFLLDGAGGNRFYTFTVGAITGGAVGEAVTDLGFTILTRNGGGTPTITVTVTFSDLTTASASAGFTITTNPIEDTFFGFSAPSGKSISSVTLDYGAAGGDLRRGIDDFAFITAVVPEPSSCILVLGAILFGCGFRRRSI